MTFDAPNIICALIFSAVGLGYFRYGKKQAEPRMMIIGLGLMVYSYFTPTIAWNVIAGAALSALPLVWK